MARSLMELYGGGMVYPANNYQLGGVIASARRGREYQGEMRQLKEQQEKIAKEQQRAGMWGSILGTVGSIAGTALAGPAGTAVGAGIGGGLGRFLGEKQYKTTKIGEGKYGKQTRKDIGEAQKEFKAGMGERALVSGLQSAMMGEAFGKISKGIGEGIGGLSEAMEAGSEMGLTKGQALSDYFKSFQLPSAGAGAAGVSAMVGTQGGGLIDYMMPRRMQTGGYATATDPLNALEQMGFEGIADDPRLQEYMEDLPDWQQGYAQQVGNITTAGQQQMGQIGTQMRQQQAQAGFGGSGIGAGAAQQDRAGVGQEFQRGRRGIVAGFQADLLAGIRDIEAKGEFEFGDFSPETVSDAEQQYLAQDPWYQLGFPDEASWQNWVNAGSDYSQIGAYGGSGTASQQNLSATLGLSDVRLKKDVHRLFTMKNNVPIYMFKYKWSDDINIGTMAQDIEGFMPEAIGEIGGYKTVNYDIVFNSRTGYKTIKGKYNKG